MATGRPTTAPEALGARVRALREAMDLSLRDLAERSGVERADALAGRARRDQPDAAGGARGSPPASSCACRSCCASTRTARSRSSAPPSAARARPRPRPQLRDPHAAAARPARRALAPHAGAAARSPAAPATRRCTSPAAARRRWSSRARSCSSATAQRHELAAGDCVTFDADLPHHFENPGPEEAVAARGRERRPAKELSRPMPQTPVRQDLGRPRGRPQPDLHRPAPGPRGDEPAGVRRAAAGRPQGAPARPDARHRRPQRAHRRDAVAAQDPGRARRASRSRRSSATARSSASRCTRSGSEHQGIVHVIGPELGRHPAGHDDRLRRLAHRHPRRVRRAGVRDRHQRGRARAGDADAWSRPSPGRCGSATTGELGFGVTAKDLILATIGQIGVARRRRPRRRVRGPGDRGALDGGPDDRLQHDDRGRRPRRDDRPRRHHVRVGDRPPGRAARGPGRRGARCSTDAGADVRPRDRRRRRRDQPDGHLGHEPGDGRAGHRRRARAAAPSRTSGRSTTWALRARARRSQEIKLDRVFIGSCTNSRIGDLRAAAEVVGRPQGGRRRLRDGRARLRSRSRPRPSSEGLDEVFRRAGFDWRGAGCSMCLGMNPDIAAAGRARRLDLEPQLRGSPGARRALAPGVPADGRRGGHRGPFRRHPGVGAAMKAIETITGRVSVLNRDDVDTDQIIPKQFLKRVERTGFGEFLFFDWAKEPGWDLPKNPILVAGTRTSAAARAASTPPGRSRTTASRRSSRRASPTSSAPTAPRSGCCRCSCPPMTCASIAEAGEAQVDLAGQEVRWPGGTARFEIDSQIKHRLLNGLDDIAATLAEDSEAIDAYERDRRAQRSGHHGAVSAGRRARRATGTRRRTTASPTSRPAGRREQLERLDVARRRGRARRRVRLGPGDRAAGRPGCATAASMRSTWRRRWPSTPRRRSATGPRCSARTWSSSTLPEPVDALFSNATFHWMPRPRRAVRAAASRRSSPAAGSSPSAAGAGNIDTFRVLADEVAGEEPFAPYFTDWQGRGTTQGPEAPRSGCGGSGSRTSSAGSSRAGEPGGPARRSCRRCAWCATSTRCPRSCASRSSTGCSSAPAIRSCWSTCG